MPDYSPDDAKQEIWLGAIKINSVDFMDQNEEFFNPAFIRQWLLNRVGENPIVSLEVACVYSPTTMDMFNEMLANIFSFHVSQSPDKGLESLSLSRLEPETVR